MYVVNNKKNDTIYDLDLINFSGNKLKSRFEKAQEQLEKGREDLRIALNTKDNDIPVGTNPAVARVNKPKRFIQIADLDDESLLQEARDMLAPLTKSTRQEANANVVEERRTSTMGQMADLKAERIPLLKEKGKIPALNLKGEAHPHFP